MFQKQKIMLRVVYSLIPIYLFAVYLYGWRLLAHSIVVFATGIFLEYVMTKRRKKKVSQAVLVTCALYTLSLPPATPLWISMIGIAFAIFIAKEAFGGFGRNIFNPAISGRMFIYLTFPAVLASSWMVPGLFGTSYNVGIDALSSATPLALIRNGEFPSFNDMVWGFHAGSFGESSIFLILIAALYMIFTKTASVRLMLSTFLSATLLAAILYFSGLIPGMNPENISIIESLRRILIYLFSGALLFMVVYMATDPVTAPNSPLPQLLYGSIIGCVTILIRVFSGFPEGVSFGILVGNTFSPWLEEVFAPKKKKKKKPAEQLGSNKK